MKLLWMGILNVLENYGKVLARRACMHEWDQVREVTETAPDKRIIGICYVLSCKKCGKFSSHAHKNNQATITTEDD